MMFYKNIKAMVCLSVENTDFFDIVTEFYKVIHEHNFSLSYLPNPSAQADYDTRSII